jgi:hypothetical protein
MHKSRPQRIALDLAGLTGRVAMLRFPGATKRNASVDDWLRDDPAGLRAIAAAWFERMRQCGDDVVDLIHDGCPVACVGDAPFGYVNAFKSHVNVGFFQGAALADPTQLLQGSGKRMRHVKVRPGRALDRAALAALIEAAYADIKARLDAENGFDRK